MYCIHHNTERKIYQYHQYDWRSSSYYNMQHIFLLVTVFVCTQNAYQHA